MSAVAFDTLKLARALRDRGKLTPEQAEGVAEALSEAFREEIATKGDLAALSAEIKTEIKTEIKLAESRLEAKVEAAQVGIVKWLVPLLLGQAALIAALVKLL